MSDKKNNTSTDNSGYGNTGDKNTGDGNTGDKNTGDGNTGDWNTGNKNSGYGNSGNKNSGYGNSGDWNSGNKNSGYGNSGYGNTGDWNSGNKNSGDWNSGNKNSGYGNSGYGNTGAFNTVEPNALFFNKPTSIKMSEFLYSAAWPDFYEMNPCVWIEESIMTDDEKTENPTYKSTGGYIKKLSYKDAWAVWKRKCSEENWQKVLALPNFDPHIWEEITGIRVEDNSEAKKKATELREKADELLAQAKALEESL